jgi:Pup-ligase protein
MKPFLMGTETEYAVSGRNGALPIHAERVYDLLNDALRNERRWLPDVVGRDAMYLEHGGRFYLDFDAHPEYATPECSTPKEVAAYDKAGERLLEIARTRAERLHPQLHVTIIKNNLDPIEPDENSYGCHESYTCWVPLADAAQALIPHLVSRILYAGAGCLSARDGASGFELSQRARHLVLPIGEDTIRSRPIFCTRIRKASDAAAGWTRAHMVGKDSQRAPFGIYLTFATTGLLFALLNEGVPVGAGLALKDPVQALQDLARDPWLKVRVPLADGRHLSALEIQECYLQECERALAAGGWPAWAPEALGHWRATLQTLARNPLEMADRLDPYCKLLIFGHELQKAGYQWPDLHCGLKALRALRYTFTEPVVNAVLTDNRQALTDAGDGVFYDAAVRDLDISGADLPLLRFTLRMQALDLAYHELGGLYDRLRLLGRVRDVVLTADDVERATRQAPPGGRAALRSAAIKGYPASEWVCDWQYLFHMATSQCLDMRDPFAGERHVVTLPELPPQAGRRVTILDRLMAACG